MVEYERKRVKVGKAGGSPSVVLPKAWVEEIGRAGEVDLVRSEHRIVIETPREASEPDFEDEPEFGRFLLLLRREALRTHRIGEAADLVRRAAELTAGVELDD